MKAIETAYRGYRFRSRLEARYAVFFDKLGVRWEYEPEGVTSSAGPYLPDFLLHLPGQPVLFEVKPELELGQHDPRWAAAAAYFDLPFIIASGMPDPAHVELWQEPGDGHLQQIHPYFDNNFAFCICPDCGAVGLQFEGRGARICAGPPTPGTCGKGETGGRGETSTHPRILTAYRAARSARFEHGERPR